MASTDTHKPYVSAAQLMQYFYDNQIYPGVHYIDNTSYSMYSNQLGICPNSEKYSERLITLPIHLNLSNEDLKRVVIVLKEGISDLLLRECR